MRKLIVALCLLALLPLTAGADTSQPVYKEGTQYQRIDPPQPGAEGDRVQVTEVFWYGCPHCYDMEPLIAKWLQHKPDYVDFVRVPAMFARPDVQMHAEAFYALQAMGKEAGLRQKIFDAMHKEHRDLRTPEQFEAWLAEQGVDLKAYRAAKQSFSVQADVKRASRLALLYGIQGVPALVVDGRYKTSPADAGGYQEALTVTDFLIAKVRAEKAAK
jgi:thiol:disulfide interchange protein DsbA